MHSNLAIDIDAIGNVIDASSNTMDGFCVIMELTAEEKQELIRMWMERLRHE